MPKRPPKPKPAPTPQPDPEAVVRLKAEIVAHLNAGATFRELAALPGMPPARRTEGWRRADPDFAAAVDQARRHGRHQRHRQFDEARAQAFLARFRTGEPLGAILADPAMPRHDTWRHWRRTQNHFNAEVLRLMDIHAESRRQVRRQAPPPFPYDRDTGDRIIARVYRGERLKEFVTPDPALPSLEAVRRWRRERPAFDATLRFAAQIGVHARHRRERREGDLMDTIMDRIVAGASFGDLGKQPDMPCAMTLSRWVRDDREFAKMIAWACDLREQWYGAEIAEVADAATPTTMKLAKKKIGALSRQECRLRNRPGKRWRKGE